MSENKQLWQALKDLVQQTLGFYETLHLAQKLRCLQNSDRITSAMYTGIKQETGLNLRRGRSHDWCKAK
jgi:hypothetical protein